jgi:hypothetical protein
LALLLAAWLLLVHQVELQQGQVPLAVASDCLH